MWHRGAGMLLHGLASHTSWSALAQAYEMRQQAQVRGPIDRCWPSGCDGPLECLKVSLRTGCLRRRASQAHRGRAAEGQASWFVLRLATECRVQILLLIQYGAMTLSKPCSLPAAASALRSCIPTTR